MKVLLALQKEDTPKEATQAKKLTSLEQKRRHSSKK